MPTDAERIAELEREVESLRGAIGLLHRITTLVQSALEIEPTRYSILTGVTAGVGLGLNRAMMFLANADRTVLDGVAAIGPADADEADRIWRRIESHAPDLEELHAAGLRKRARAGNLDRFVRATHVDALGTSPVALCFQRDGLCTDDGDDDLGGLLHLPTAIAAPIAGHGGPMGVLYADNRYTGRPIEPLTQQVFVMVAEHAGRALESARQIEALEREARTDSLTGLGHHGALRDELARAVAAAAHQGKPVGLAMIDIDDFKRVNDEHGHLAGDAVLRGIADRMRGILRTRERPFRYGGEEFAVLLYGADVGAAARIGERLRRVVGGHPYPAGTAQPLRVTCSVGVASIPEGASDCEGLIAAADGALLRAKAAGKDRVETA